MSNIRLFFSGDFCSKPSTSKISVSDELKELIQSCDWKVVNFEVPLKPKNSSNSQGRFFQNDDAPSFLLNLGFNLFSFANNHAFDYGIEGWKKTVDSLSGKIFGSGRYDDAYQVKIVEKNGLKIGFLALTYAARFGVFDNFTDKDSYACAWINDLKVNHIIIDAKKKVDYLVILPHDGIEYIDVPMPETISRYRDFIEYGADAVIGTHPHCPQGWEVYKGKPIFYSLGNFLFNSKDNYDYRAWNRPHWYEGLCVIVSFGVDGITYQVINTRNEGNVGISVEHSTDRDEHNRRLCSYLTDKEAYSRVLNKECSRLMKNQEMPIINQSFHSVSLKSSVLLLFKTLVRVVLKRNNDTALVNLVKNDSRRSLLIRGLQETSDAQGKK